MLRILESLGDLPAAQWDRLHDGSNPFVSHAFLHGLEVTGCLRPAWGWVPRHVALFDGDDLIAAAPAYLKSNSHGEFVFDHAWASAYDRTGQAYYPKWLIGVPYSPVPGPRLLARDASARKALAEALIQDCVAQGLSSVHVNFLPDLEAGAFDDRWLGRHDVQFHWRNSDDWQDFTEFLAAMTHKRRKAIRQERTKVQRAGYRFRVMRGDEASAADLQSMHELYCLTFASKGNTPTLTLQFFKHLAETMPHALVLVLAELDGHTMAGALFMRGGDTLYGRYWGSEESVPGLHFETCYYQGIEYCLREGLQHFEPGAQGEHKLARGFLPVLTNSRHFVAHDAFAQALAPWCRDEREHTVRYRDQLLLHSPFRHVPATT